MKPTIANLRNAVADAGGTLEEDHPGLDVRHLQLVAPNGKRWRGRQVQCAPVMWAKRQHLDSAQRFNAEAFKDAMDCVNRGLEDIPEEDRYLYTED